MKKALSIKTWLIWTLRKASYRWPPRQQALRDAEVSLDDDRFTYGEKIGPRIRKVYECAKCGLVFSRKGVSVDHIEPVVDPKRGWQGWDSFIERLFCAAEGFQVICHEDHDAKTEKERKVRTTYKRASRIKQRGA